MQFEASYYAFSATVFEVDVQEGTADHLVPSAQSNTRVYKIFPERLLFSLFSFLFKSYELRELTGMGASVSVVSMVATWLSIVVAIFVTREWPHTYKVAPKLTPRSVLGVRSPSTSTSTPHQRTNRTSGGAPETSDCRGRPSADGCDPAGPAPRVDGTST